jgi:hypothetical protein
VAADLLTPAEDARDSLESYNDAMRAIGERVKAGAPVPMFLRSQSALPGLDEPPNKPKPQRAKAEAKPRLKRAAKPRAVGKTRDPRLSVKMKRRALEARRFGGECDGQASQALAEDYRDPNRQGQDRPLISEDGQPVARRVGLPRSRQP